ncbi:peptide deformylase [Rummeliibacillus sp. TYF005]|mgnify:FL=1|uniref:peptide deformylase n=1 Tax=unclassified Rummeliibacillus TaxID=2622809 RepID=UPI000E66798F|nr:MULTISPECIES: peptide deformylase [unclassified Rummeliibacillus]RIJ69197.1 peptide deformylase [Rummeliibacillus sp. POC4]RPJ96930.1 peptide deformylase [Rummeliibacillus sp. TYF005]
MALLEIVKNPAKILETKAAEVTKFNADLAKLLDDMYETMLENDGVGIAAPQVNKSIQAAVVELGEERDVLELINPVIVEVSEDTGVDMEGCLSFPDLYGDVERPLYVKVQAQDRTGALYELEAYDYDARVIQHEIDHLHGILFDKKITRIYTLQEIEEMYAEEDEEQ